MARWLLAFVLAAAAGCSQPKRVQAPLPPLARAVYADYLRGKLAAYKTDWPAAIEALTRAAAAAPDQPMIAVELAKAQIKAEKTAAALATLAAARAKWPEHPQVWLVSADLLASSDKAQATAAYLQAIQLAPDDERAYLGLSKLQRPDAAEATLQILLRRVPSSVDGHYRLAGRLAARNELAGAIHALHEVLERDPDHIDARLDLARALRRQGHLDQAIVETRGAFDRSGQALDIAEELFWLLCEADDRNAAIDLLTLLDDDRSDADALAVTARLDRGLGRLAEARGVAHRISRTRKDAAAIDAAAIDAAAIALARIELAAGDRMQVHAALAPITDGSKLAGEAHRIVAEAALAAGEPQAALTALAPELHGPQARPKSPDDTAGEEATDGSARTGALDSALLAAFALADLGRLTEAQAQLAPFDSHDAGEQRAVVLARARLAERVGDVPGALALLEPLIRSQPDFVAALNLAGYLLADTNQRLDDAERYLRHARDLAPGDPEILDSWGWLLLRRGRSREAVRALDRASRFAPLEPEILVHLAAAWTADGAPKTARATLDRAATLRPAWRCGSGSRYDGAMKRWILAGTLLAVGCKNAPSDDQCKQLLDHLIDLEFKKAGASNAGDSVKAEMAKQKQAVADAKANEFVETCTKKTSRARVECALSASDLDAVARCDEAK